MSRDSGQTFGFLRAVHRRHVLLRAAEHGAMGVLTGGFAGLVMLAAAMLTHGPLMPVWMMAMAGCAGGIFGAVAGWIRRPSMLESAMEADRQLDNTDLFSTAWTLRRNADPWARQVVVCADVQSGQLSPSAVLLARWGSRGWGSVGLLCVLMMCASLLMQQTQVTRAANRTTVSGTDLPIAPSGSKAVAPGDFEPSPLSPSRAGSADAVDSPIGQPDVAAGPDSTGVQSPETARGSKQNQSTNSDGAGAGMARTHSGQPTAMPEPSASRGGAAPKSHQSHEAAGGDPADQPHHPGLAPFAQGRATVEPGTQKPAAAASNSSDVNARPGNFDQQAQPQYQPYASLIREYFQRD